MILVWMFVVCGAVFGRYPNPPIFTAVQYYPSICYLPPDSGLCVSNQEESELEVITRFYFDTTTNACYPFGVQGCGGNENRFKTNEECQKYCILSTV